MKTTWYAHILALAAATTTAPPIALAQETAASRLEEGQVVAMRLCARCHAVSTDDVSPFEPAPPFRDIAARYSVWHLQEALAEGIVVGHDAMPRFALPPEDIDALLAYMETLGEPPR